MPFAHPFPIQPLSSNRHPPLPDNPQQTREPQPSVLLSGAHFPQPPTFNRRGATPHTNRATTTPRLQSTPKSDIPESLNPPAAGTKLPAAVQTDTLPLVDQQQPTHHPYTNHTTPPFPPNHSPHPPTQKRIDANNNYQMPNTTLLQRTLPPNQVEGRVLTAHKTNQHRHFNPRRPNPRHSHHQQQKQTHFPLQKHIVPKHTAKSKLTTPAHDPLPLRPHAQALRPRRICHRGPREARPRPQADARPRHRLASRSSNQTPTDGPAQRRHLIKGAAANHQDTPIECAGLPLPVFFGDPNRRSRALPPHHHHFLTVQLRAMPVLSVLPPAKENLIRARGKIAPGNPFGAGSPAQTTQKR